MGEIRIHRSDPARFVKIPNDTAFAPLSYAALGWLTAMLAHPPDWEPENARQAAARARKERGADAERENRLERVFAELERAGYRHRVLRRGGGGQVVTETHYYDMPTWPCPDSRLCRTCRETAGRTDPRNFGWSVPPGQTR